MKVVVVNGTYRPAGTTTELAHAFMEGVSAGGGEAGMIILHEKKIGRCTNCLRCYAFEGEGPAPCSLQDDMDEIIERLAEADGVLLASPVHCGFVSGLMTIFHERMTWRVMVSGKPLLGCVSLKSRLSDKVRAIASIVSAGGMPESLGKRYCNDGTSWLKGNLPLELHGQWIGDLYAGADLERLPENERDWKRLYFLRQLSERQKREAHALGMKMTSAIRSGRLRPFTMETMIPASVRWALKILTGSRPRYTVAS